MDYKNLSDSELQALVNTKEWYHKIQLRKNVFTNGSCPINARAYHLPNDLSGKRILDVGSWDGYWCFEALRRGAKQVIAIDNFSDLCGTMKKRKDWENFDICKSVFGYTDKQCERIEMDVEQANSLGHFDIILFFGVVYHLRHPVYVLDMLSKMCDEIYIESAICDDCSGMVGAKGECLKGYKQECIMRYYPAGDLYGGNSTNFFVPTLYCLEKLVQSNGFDTNAWKLCDNSLSKYPNVLPYSRGFVYGKK